MIIPWAAQRSSPSILKITPGISLEGMMLKLKLQYFGHLMRKVDLNNKIQKTEIKASSHITSWQIDGETVETVVNFIFLGPQITAEGECSHEMKRCLLLERKVMINLDNILKSRDITLPTKARLVKAMVFPVVMYLCDSWTKQKAESQRMMLLNCGVGEDS